MSHLKNIFFFSSSFSEKAGRIEYGCYLLFNFLMFYIAIDLNRKVNLDNASILYLFYDCLIILFIFIPMQAVTTRRLRDLGANPAYIVFNFVPIVNIAFVIFLLFAKQKQLKNYDLDCIFTKTP